jgi:hypothetical protein
MICLQSLTIATENVVQKQSITCTTAAVGTRLCHAGACRRFQISFLTGSHGTAHRWLKTRGLMSHPRRIHATSSMSHSYSAVTAPDDSVFDRKGSTSELAKSPAAAGAIVISVPTVSLSSPPSPATDIANDTTGADLSAVPVTPITAAVHAAQIRPHHHLQRHLSLPNSLSTFETPFSTAQDAEGSPAHIELQGLVEPKRGSVLLPAVAMDAASAVSTSVGIGADCATDGSTVVPSAVTDSDNEAIEFII